MRRMIPSEQAADRPSSYRHLHKVVNSRKPRGGVSFSAGQPLLVLHVELADIGVTEILFIPFEIFLSHLIGIYEMNLRVLHMDVILKPGEQIRIVFVFMVTGSNIEKHPMKRSAVSSFISKTAFSFSLSFTLFFSFLVKLVRIGTTSFDCRCIG